MSMRINQFFQSVINNDFNRSRDVLIKIGQHINVHYYKNSSSKLVLEQIDSYYSCFLILVSSQQLWIQNIKLLVDDFNAFNKSVTKIDTNREVREAEQAIKKMLIVKSVSCFAGYEDPKRVNERIMKNSIAKFIKSLMKDFKVAPEDIASHNDVDTAVFQQVCKVAKVKVAPSIPDLSNQPQDTQDKSIESFKDANGFMSLTSLCAYISSRKFKGYGPGKLYEIFDTLEPQEQTKFMHNYQAFNQLTQLNVESHCLDLVEDIEAQKRPDVTSIHKFKSDNSDMLYQWFLANVTELDRLAKQLSNNNSLSDLGADEQVLAKYIIHWNLIPKNALVTLILSNLLNATLSSSKEYVRLTELVRRIATSFKRLVYKESSYRSIREEVLKRFDEDGDGIILFTSLLKIVLDNCKINLSASDQSVLEASSALEWKPEFSNNPSNYQAFSYSQIRYDKGKLLGVVSIHPYLFKKMKTYDSLTFNKSLYLPMLCPPKPWTSPVDGGYLKDLKPIVSSSEISTCLTYMNQAHKTGQLNSLYEGLNTLGQNAWAVNSRVLQVYNEVMENPSGFLKIPPQLSALSEQQENFHELKGLRIQYNMIKLIANSFDENGDMFYLPHGVDFRGRAYPMVSELSHYQQDSVRGLMCFWYSKPLGPTGFNWVKYQLVGVFGEDKLTMKQRINFFDEHLDFILDSARNPLDGKMWWKSAEKPWQTLALCMEADQIIKFQEHDNIENYRSRIPIHQDGSCNGLQHYAALGADREGGLSVNLLPLENDKRGDVYSKVLEIVQEKVSKDVKQGAELAAMAKSILSRKLIKQTVMTTVYGVTNYGGAAQVEQRIKEHIEDVAIRSDGRADSSVLVKHQRKLALYVTGLVLNSVSELFSGAKLIQDWLLENCYRIINSFDLETVSKYHGDTPKFLNTVSYKPMMWTSLSGFPVVQLYKHTRFSLIPTTLQSVKINRPTDVAPINKKKQMNAVAPNFIHSLDSIHMLMTAVSSRLASIGFVSVHDSFWTYPSDVEVLSKILRQEFVRLHSSNIIGNLREDMLYTTNKAFQLVWIENVQNQELVDQIEQVRSRYSEDSIPNILRHELELQSHGPSEISQLIDSYSPQLFMRSKSGRAIESYTDRVGQERIVRKLQMKKFTPVLVPVRILECPPRGDLDVSQVLESKYFFS